MSRAFVAHKGSASRNKPSTSPKYKMFIWDVGTDSKEPHEATIRTIAILEYSSPGAQISRFSSAVRPPNVKTENRTPTFSDVWTDITDFIYDHDEGKPPLLVSHNAAFDVTVLLGELRRNRIKVPPSWRFACSLLLARSIFSFADHNSQLALASRLGIDVKRPHNTSEDVVVLRRILCALDDKAVEDDKPINRVVPALCLHARSPPFFDRTPQFEAESKSTTQTKFFITATGTKYHRDGCRWLGRSKIPRVTPPPGFEPCRSCRPDANDNVVHDSPVSAGSSRAPDANAGHRFESVTTSSRSPSQFFVTNNGSKYHVHGCKWLSKSRIPVDSPPSDMKPCRTCLSTKAPRTTSTSTYDDDAESETTSFSEELRSLSDEAPYYITRTGAKYHVKGCKMLAQSRIPKNERPAGYDPCGICCPNIAYSGTPKLRTMKKL